MADISQVVPKGMKSPLVLVTNNPLNETVSARETVASNPRPIISKSATHIQRFVRGQLTRIKLNALIRQNFKCPITQDNILLINATLTKCGHIFDRTSLNTWIKGRPSVACPSCRCNIVSINSQLLLFAQKGATDDLRNIIKFGANVHATDEDGWTALHLAAAKHQPKIVDQLNLLGSNLTATYRAWNFLLNIARFDSKKTTCAVTEFGANIKANYRAWSALLKKEGSSQTKTACALKAFKKSLKVTYCMWSRLLADAYSEHTETLRALAILGKHLESIYLRWVALLNVARLPHLETIHVLIESGANLDATNKNGCTALHLAEQNGNKEIAQILINAGASPAS
ncbi:MAG: ankyrin repeat domain-containing protein [Candidatus Margulisiibacteriota bacterium]